MKFQETSQVPDDTYFRVADAEPTIENDGMITILNGEGTRRSSWGRPQVNTTVLVDDCDFFSALIGFSHKHGGGQFYRHYIATVDGPQRKTWRGLTRTEQELVREAYDEKAPHWAKSPGKFKEERKTPTSSKFTAYKVMRWIEDDLLLSLYDDTEWRINKRNGQAVGENAGRQDDLGDTVHAGGFYVHKSAERIVTLFKNHQLVPERCYSDDATYVLVKCECYGRIAEFSSGKLAVTYCTPVRICENIL